MFNVELILCYRPADLLLYFTTFDQKCKKFWKCKNYISPSWNKELYCISLYISIESIRHNIEVCIKTLTVGIEKRVH